MIDMKQFFESVIERVRREPWSVALCGYVIFLLAYQWHNSLSFNPYWGYDGGEHIDYILSLARNHQFPDFSHNTVAWHEPLYYCLQAILVQPFLFWGAGMKTLLKVFSITQLVISLATTFVLYQLISLFSENKAARLLAFVVLTSLPAFVLASTFVTNELLNDFFAVLILYFLFRWFIFRAPRPAHYLLLGFFMGLALLTKITALVVVVLTLFYLITRVVQKTAGFTIPFVLLTIIPLILLYAPWYMYRHTEGLGLSINNVDFLPPAPLVLDGRVNFFLGFDPDIFRFPYWYSGGRAFSSMLYADSFYDYYGMMENRDWLALQPKENLIRTTASNTVVSAAHALDSRWLVWLGVFPLALCALGVFAMAKAVHKKRQLSAELLGLIVTVSFLAAIVYFSYRYPYYDHGIVKSIFIWPLFMFPVVFGSTFLSTVWTRRCSIIVSFFASGLIVYVIILRSATWIVRYNY